MAKGFEIWFSEEHEATGIDAGATPPDSGTMQKPGKDQISYDHWFNPAKADPFSIAVADEDAGEPLRLSVIQGGLSKRAKDALVLPSPVADHTHQDAAASNVIHIQFSGAPDLMDIGASFRDDRDCVHFSTQSYADLLMGLDSGDLTPEVIRILLTARWDPSQHPKLFTPETIDEIIDLVQNGLSPISILRAYDPYVEP